MPSAGTATSVAELNLLGGDPALDFANTIEWRDGRDPLDLLRTPGDLVAWASRAGLPIGPVRASGDLDEATALREHVHDAFRAIARAEQPDATDLEAIAHAASAELRVDKITT